MHFLKSPLVRAYAFMFVFVLGCAAFKPIARTVLDLALATCLAENQGLTNSAELQAICPWVEADAPLVEKFLQAQRRGMAKSAARCADAGAP